MSDHDALLRAVCENPRDDLPRLAYADWLEENGDPERAQFIRTEIDIYRRPEWDGERARYVDTAPPDGRPWMKHFFAALPGVRCALGRVAAAPPRVPVVPVRRHAGRSPRRPPGDDARAGAGRPARIPLRPDRPPPARRQRLAPRLTGLALGRGPYPADRLDEFLADPRTAGLEEFAFLGGSATREAVAAVFRSPLLPRLTAFGVEGNRGEVGRAVLELLRDTPNQIGTLDLRDNLPGDDGIPLVASGCIPPTVRVLDLTRNRISAARAGVLFGSAALASVRVLNLMQNSLGNAGAVALAASPHLPELRVLDLSYCQVGDDGILALLDSPLADRLVLLTLAGSPAAAETKAAAKVRMGDRLRL